MAGKIGYKCVSVHVCGVYSSCNCIFPRDPHNTEIKLVAIKNGIPTERSTA